MSTFIAIDLKSFYASVECVERGFDPLTTNLVVADESRTEKTICLAVSPSLKSYGISGRARLFEVNQRVKEVNRERLKEAKRFVRESFFNEEVKKDIRTALSFYIAPPRMAYYMRYSSKIYSIYLKYVSKEDIHVYSIDEVFIDVSNYLNTYKMSARELAMTMIKEVYDKTGITATCGIGSNMYLAKIAMDIKAKHMEADENGVRMAELDEMSYRREFWEHEPLTDFWRIGKGIAAKLNDNGMHTMGDVARMSLINEDFLYKLFGVNAELIIDHAWGYENVEIKDIKSYVPENQSICLGQVLKESYSYEKTRLIIKEMAELLSLDLVKKNVVCDQIVLNVGYDIDSLKDYRGTVEKDRYGRNVPKSAHGSINLDLFTSSSKLIREATLKLFDRIADKSLGVRRLNITANHIYPYNDHPKKAGSQIDLFSDEEVSVIDESDLKKEKNLQEALIKIKGKYGKNAVLRANSLEEGATAIERNESIGGHRA